MSPDVSLDIICFLVQKWPESFQNDSDGFDALKIALVHEQPDGII